MAEWLSWELNNDVLALLAAFWVAYTLGWGWLRLRGNSAASVGRLVCWSSGLLTIAIATMSAIDAMASSLLSLHMVQHVLFMYVAPPLMLLARPLSLWQAAFSSRNATPASGVFPLQSSVLKCLRFILKPGIAWAVATITLLVWHVPAAYDYALLHPNVHDYVEHTTMFFAFLIWWHPLIGSMPSFPYLATSKARFIYVVASWIPSMVLGWVILFWPTVLYTYYLSVPQTASLSIQLDQQLAALIMLASGWATLFVLAIPLEQKDLYSLTPFSPVSSAERTTERGSLQPKYQTLAILGILVIQGLLGSSIKLFATFSPAQSVHSLGGIFRGLASWRMETVVHASLGIVLIVLATGILVTVLRSASSKGIRIFSTAGLACVLSAAAGGILFAFSGYQNDRFSAEMLGSFVTAFISYSALVSSL